MLTKTYKTCSCCGEVKPVTEFHQYFSKKRNKIRVYSKCKLCANAINNHNSKDNYKKNKEKKLKYAKEYREKNKEKIKEERGKYKRKQIDELQNCYIRYLLISKNNIERQFIIDNPSFQERLQEVMQKKQTDKKS